MRITEWKSNKSKVARLAELLNDPVFREFDAVMMNEHPMNQPLTIATPEHLDSKKLGHIEGYNWYRSLLLSGAVYQPDPKELNASFADPFAPK